MLTTQIEGTRPVKTEYFDFLYEMAPSRQYHIVKVNVYGWQI